MPLLQSLLLDGLWDKEDDVLQILSERSPRLQDLEVIFNCWEVTKRTLRDLSAVQSLKSLKLDGCCVLLVIDDVSIDRLTQRLAHLRLLSIQVEFKGSPQLTHNSLLAVLRNCNTIEELHLSIDITNFDMASPLQLKRPSTSLRRLTLACGPPPEHLRRAAENLVAWCPNVTEPRIMEQRYLETYEPLEDEHGNTLEYDENKTEELFNEGAALELTQLFCMLQCLRQSDNITGTS
ncbi:hypothetical protein FRB95_000629 [Tulasnella sp. JGI-2019a]|nr:hypothetical protein FRB95_000629 [Tulasnella sp. JGI-2019a]